MLTLSIGPLNGLRFRFAKTRPDGKPGEGGGTAPNAELPSLTAVESRERPPGLRTRRMLEGKEDEVGVAGRTLMLLCGDFVSLLWCEPETDGDPMDIEDVEEALE